MNRPLVSVIVVCYNHEAFVEEAVRSVVNQTWSPIQLIVVDDHSTDQSPAILQNLRETYPQMELLLLPQNLGNCAAFNRGLARAMGDYVIDLAADDMLEPDRVSRGVQVLEAAGPEAGIHYSDAFHISEGGTVQGLHSDRFPHHTIPQGDVNEHVIRRYFICSPSMMMRKSMLDHLHGYDETLAYEDFDILVRASRQYRFVYSPEALVRKRKVAGSLGQLQFGWRSRQAESTYRVCAKARALNRTESEWRAWRGRILYECRSSFQRGSFGLALRYLLMLRTYFRLSSPVTILT